MMPEDNRSNMPSPPQTYNILPSNEAFNRWLESFDEEIEQLEHTLRGEIFLGFDKIERKNIYKQVNKPIMNESGIQFISSYLRMNLNKNIWMSNVDEERIYLICDQTVTPLITLLAERQIPYEFDIVYLETVVMGMVANNLEMGLRRALGGNELKHVLPTEQIHTTRYMEDLSANQQKGGFNLFAFGKK